MKAFTRFFIETIAGGNVLAGSFVMYLFLLLVSFAIVGLGLWAFNRLRDRVQERRELPRYLRGPF